MNDLDGGEHAALLPNAANLLRPRRSFVRPLLVFVSLIAVALMVVIGIGRLRQVEQPKPPAQNESPPQPQQPDVLPEQASEPAAEPFKSFVLDAAQLYLATGRLSVVTTMGPDARRSSMKPH
jgi:hypothetical protein